jgi:hypothetical protein
VGDAHSSSGRDVITKLADCLREGDVATDRRKEHDRLWLPKAPGADYQFYVDVFDAGAATIGALLEGQSEEAFFWHLPLEYRADDAGEALGVLVQEARRLVLNPSRIVQRRGRVLWRFWCEVEEGGLWRRVGGTVACTRLLHAVPACEGTIREYRSGPLRSRA